MAPVYRARLFPWSSARSPLRNSASYPCKRGDSAIGIIRILVAVIHAILRVFVEGFLGVIGLFFQGAAAFLAGAALLAAAVMAVLFFVRRSAR